MPDGEESVVFVFQGPGIEGLVRDLVNDPARSAAFSVWAPLLEGLPCSRERSSSGKPRPVTVKVARIGSLLVFMVSSDTDSSPAKVRVL
jgi:hypothetical protein